MFSIPRELIVFFTAMLPIGEIRAAIPLGLLLGMPTEAAFFWATLGNILMIMIVLKILGPASTFLMRHSKLFNKFFTKLFHHTHTKHSAKFEKTGEIFIVAFRAIPLPGTGGWTAALLCFLFNLSYWKSIGLILLGNIISGILVTAGFGGGTGSYKTVRKIKTSSRKRTP